ncbi:MAG: type I restriction endonuclease [bacterium]
MTDFSEKKFEEIISDSLVNELGYIKGSSADYDKSFAIDLAMLSQFLEQTQPKIAESVDIKNDSNTRQKFLNRIHRDITNNGIIDVLRNGINHGPHKIELFYQTPSEGNIKTKELFEKNIFSITRQLHYSNNQTKNSIDLCLFINGLPIITFELKNNLTKQTVDDAVRQYKNTRDSRELLFRFRRCIVHFALDEHRIQMCTHLKDKESWFLTFDKGFNDGAGNPQNPNGFDTDYLWKEILNKGSLSNIIEKFAGTFTKEDKKTNKKKIEQIFPRYHQLDVVRELLKNVRVDGVGKKYLIQHSAGSGKSNSITWLAHQLVGLRKDDKEIFDSIIVVTDRKILDKQLAENIKKFAQVSDIVGAVKEGSAQLKDFIQSGKKIIISTIQKFPYILDEIGDDHRNRNFAIIIDEAHSSQGGRASTKMHMVLAEPTYNYSAGEEDVIDVEDLINDLIEKKKMLSNASYFAFTATPKAKTLQVFGTPVTYGDQIKYVAFHNYTMKQAIEEGFILDVLQNYTPVYSYYKLIKAIEEDPEYDTKKAKKKLRHYVESHKYAIRQKAEIMVDHFLDNVIGKYKIGGQARAMVVCSGIERAIQYYYAISDYLLNERHSPYKAIVAFSGEHDYIGEKLTETNINQFPSKDIPDNFEKEPYRFLIVADKFQTGFDQPLLHTMYVDKQLAGIKAVQTLSRLNRAHPQKTDTFILDFMNTTEVIQFAFEDYYRSTILSDELDPDILHDLKLKLDKHQVYTQVQVDNLVEMFLINAERDKFEPILSISIHNYISNLNEDEQVDFKSSAKAFVRTYNFLSTILPYNNIEWEKLSVFLNLLIPKLPAPKEEDLSKGILETIDMESYRVEVKEKIKITLEDEDAEIDPIPVQTGGIISGPELDLLSNILKTFNDQFGNIPWNDIDKIAQTISEEIPVKVSADKAYHNAIIQGDRQNARIEHDRALERVIVDIANDHNELFKQFMDNDSFRRWLTDTIFTTTYNQKVI